MLLYHQSSTSCSCIIPQVPRALVPSLCGLVSSLCAPLLSGRRDRKEALTARCPCGVRMEINAQEGGRGTTADSHALAAAINGVIDSMGGFSRERHVCRKVDGRLQARACDSVAPLHRSDSAVWQADATKHVREEAKQRSFADFCMCLWGVMHAFARRLPVCARACVLAHVRCFACVCMWRWNRELDRDQFQECEFRSADLI